MKKEYVIIAVIIIYFVYIKKPDVIKEPCIINSESILVEVRGDVHNPGVYELPVESRVYEALALSGGVLEGANVTSGSLTDTLSDGELIKVSFPSFQETSKIDLNSASLEQLLSLPGLGEVKAKAIIAYRKNRNFTKVEDLLNVSGIGTGTFEAIQSFITVQ